MVPSERDSHASLTRNTGDGLIHRADFVAHCRLTLEYSAGLDIPIPRGGLEAYNDRGYQLCPICTGNLPTITAA